MSLSDYLRAELAVPNHTINLTEFEIFATTSLVESNRDPFDLCDFVIFRT